MEHGDRNLSVSLEGIAASLTSYGLAQSNNSISGYAFHDEIYVHVRWPWIVLPVVLQVSTIILFIATVIHSRRVGAPVWKSSLLAIWYHRTEESLDDGEAPRERLSDMRKLARATAVQLSEDEGEIGQMFKRSVDESRSGKGFQIDRSAMTSQVSED